MSPGCLSSAIVPAMNTPAPADASSPTWRDRARAAGIDPAEVEMVSSRYLAYRDYMAGRDGGLTLEGWFRFYRLEKQT